MTRVIPVELEYDFSMRIYDRTVNVTEQVFDIQ